MYREHHVEYWIGKQCSYESGDLIDLPPSIHYQIFGPAYLISDEKISALEQFINYHNKFASFCVSSWALNSINIIGIFNKSASFKEIKNAGYLAIDYLVSSNKEIKTMKVIDKNKCEKGEWHVGDVIKYWDNGESENYAILTKLNGPEYCLFCTTVLDGYPGQGEHYIGTGTLPRVNELPGSISELRNNFEGNFDHVEKVPFYGVEGVLKDAD